MKNEQSVLLTQFYKDYLAWVVAGAPGTDERFTCKAGLCWNLRLWADVPREVFDNLRSELKDQLIIAYGEGDYPFNDDVDLEIEYCLEASSGRSHQNVLRIAWVKSHV